MGVSGEGSGAPSGQRGGGEHRLDAVSLESAWTVERAERWWAMHRALPADARRVAEVLLSQEARAAARGCSRN